MATGTDSEVLKRLEGWAGPLPRSLEFYRRLLLIQCEAGSPVTAPPLHLDREAAGQRLQSSP